MLFPSSIPRLCQCPFFLSGVGLVLLLSLQVGCQSPQTASSSDSTSIVKVHDANFDSVVLQADQPVLVDFWAPWCPPCVALAPTIDELAEDFQGRAKICKLNVDEAGAVANRYDISGIPAILVFYKGEVVDRQIGLQSKEVLAAMIDKHLVDGNQE